MIKRWIIELLRKLGPPEEGYLLLLHPKEGGTWETVHSDRVPDELNGCGGKKYRLDSASGSIAHYKEVLCLT